MTKAAVSGRTHQATQFLEVALQPPPISTGSRDPSDPDDKLIPQARVLLPGRV